ncbi:MAG: winged helix-turn-helix domain-containing protein [Planctomycetes bacterium]|nr:winged helix-turn-helix domain-containing protein [Planctomycetota bacterium]MCH9723319.1 winged helix-turn-helix domain-containing protein [Planctomycetota bacterium]MCH9779106.1 winged helix-turn-helix domain-containing protein [Planctomycetota bacterium]MCH9792533.1 winged helix-turn-helix domain-containing protein [Planctomycetota bacterium]MDF1742236.1 winged helix-turn-helix domain-containing protein [Gimesia sp.]
MEQIRAHCLSGPLKAGHNLPSVWKLVQRLTVNVNTVVRDYERLSAEGLVEMRHGEGTFVLPQSAVTENSQQMEEQRDQFSFSVCVRNDWHDYAVRNLSGFAKNSAVGNVRTDDRIGIGKSLLSFHLPAQVIEFHNEQSTNGPKPG